MNRLLILRETQPGGTPEHYLGPPNVMADTARALQEKGINVSVKLIPVEGLISPRKVLSFISAIVNGVKSIPSILSSDIVNLHYMQWPNYFIYSSLAKMLGKSVIIHVYFPPRKLALLMLKGSVQVFIAMNQYISEYLIKNGISPEKVLTIPPPIDCDKFKRLDKEQLRSKYNIPPNSFVLAFHGRPATCRGLLLFLDALVVLKAGWNNMFAVVATADNTNEDVSIPEIEDFIRIHGLQSNVSLVLNAREPAEIYNLADVVVFPFLSEVAMSPPLSVLEAMACQCIVVASDIEQLGLKRMLRNGDSGFLIKPTQENLVACLQNIKQMSQDTRNWVAVNARRFVEEECSKHIVSNKFLEVLKELC